MAADRCGAGERDLLDAFAARQRFAGLGAEALHHVEHARWQQIADLFHQHADAERVCSAGFSTTQLPPASAGASFRRPSAEGSSTE